jgi:glycerol-3-phosphate dehydrogenase subunit B
VDVLIIGAGLSGLFAAWRACVSGFKTKIIAKGWGTPYMSTGCIDVLGYKPTDFLQRVDSPASYVDKFIKVFPRHPFAIVGMDNIEKGINAFRSLSEDLGYPYSGSLETNLLLPTALGAVHPTCLAPRSMIAGDLSDPNPMLIVGFSQFLDFYPSIIADNLNAQGFIASSINLDLSSLRKRKFVSGMVLARLFDKPEFRQEVIDTLKPILGNSSRIGFPAVLGIKNTAEVLKHIESSLDLPVFEIPGLPPSIPGIRMHNMLVSAIESLHGNIDTGSLVSHASAEEDLLAAVITEAAARQITHSSINYILATGGILGGGITTDQEGYAQETVFNLPLLTGPARSDWFNGQFLSDESHPIHLNGVNVDFDLHPVNDQAQIIYKNLYAVGNIIGNCDPIREHSLEGIALATGYKIAESITQGIEP